MEPYPSRRPISSRYGNPTTSTVSTPSPTTGLGGHSTFSPISSPRDTMASRMSSSSSSTGTSGASSAAKYGGKKPKGIKVNTKVFKIVTSKALKNVIYCHLKSYCFDWNHATP